MMNKLFDDEEETNEDLSKEVYRIEGDPDHEAEDSKRDKIFSNDYNTGNLEFEEYSHPKVETFYAESNLKECYDSFEYHRALKIEAVVDEYFKNTEYGKTFSLKKKVPKQSLALVYVSIREQFKSNEYTGIEIFTSIADYFGINYEILYENIPSVYRAELVKELDEKYGVLKRKGMKKLF